MANHPLRTWRLARGISGAAFARQIGVTKFSVCDWETRGRMPRPPVMKRIVDATGGLVTADDFVKAIAQDSASQGEAA